MQHPTRLLALRGNWLCDFSRKTPGAGGHAYGALIDIERRRQLCTPNSEHPIEQIGVDARKMSGSSTRAEMVSAWLIVGLLLLTIGATVVTFVLLLLLLQQQEAHQLTQLSISVIDVADNQAGRTFAVAPWWGRSGIIIAVSGIAKLPYLLRKRRQTAISAGAMAILLGTRGGRVVSA